MPDILRNLGLTRILIIAGVTLAVVAFFVFLASRVAKPDLALMYKELDTRDAGSIVAMLEGQAVPYELRGDGTEIYVPRDQVARLRMAAAEQGLPLGGSVGYEIFDNTDALGTTNFVQNVNLLRALEGELSRTIGSLDRVSAARVHLVLPKRQVFSRENQQPSASIMLKMRGNLDRARVAAIQNLVAAAVSGLEPDRVSVVDSRGNLLSRSLENGNDPLSSPSALQELRLAHEQRIKRAVESLLEQTVGAGRVRAEVSVSVDHDRVTTNSETYDPDSQVVRSTQLREETSTSSEGENQDAVTVASNLPGQNVGQNRSSRSEETVEETTNYEISRQVRTEVREAGVIRRLSVAVLVDGVYEQTGDGPATYRPRSQEQLDELTRLVKSAVGYDEERGDTIEVSNLRFVDIDAGFEDAEPTFEVMGFGKGQLMRLVEIVVLGVVALLILLLVVRPMLSRMLAGGSLEGSDDTYALAGIPRSPALAGPGSRDGTGQLALAGGETRAITDARERAEEVENMIDISQVEGRVKESSINKISEIVEKHPEEAVAIIRNWLYQDR